MTAGLIEELKKVRDFRTKKGQRHPLWFVLLLVIMGTMSGCLGYRGLGDFVKRHKQSLIETLEIPKERVPSYSTIRRVMMRVNFNDLTQVFNCWANQYVELSEFEWLATDGKSIKATVKDYSSAYQSFISVVSIFSSKQGLVVGLQTMNNKQTSEIATVQNLIAALNLKDVVFSFDALHCQKKLSNKLSTVAMIT
ncbi:ISAs1 family transposase [Nostoc sp. UHCC 0870]|uniref:ISAs1 family transposase n=1 Tax=Nostoc sp. UHCC 0870 TaxID=2914041 RepID=UPI001EE0B149|nr:ISAs1 family transposase [Nostoc sp. UHCC 0870]UKO98387.1 ISAs1 family transposase [Nostoc sp. UHCC 0870]